MHRSGSGGTGGLGVGAGSRGRGLGIWISQKFLQIMFCNFQFHNDFKKILLKI